MKRFLSFALLFSLLLSCKSNVADMAIGDLAYDDLYGPVKRCDNMLYSTEGKSLSGSYGDEVRYDRLGRLHSYVMESEERIYYDKTNRVKKTVIDKTFLDPKLTCRYYYDERGVLKRVLLSNGREFHYFDHLLDSHGNWTKRVFRLIDSEGNIEKEVVESREIEYYQ